MRNKFKIIPALLMAIICLSLPTFVLAQFNFTDSSAVFEMPVSVKLDTAAFRKFVENPNGKRIKSIHRVTHNAQGPTCGYSRLVYDIELFDDTQPTKLITERICYGKFTTFKGEKLYEPAIRYDTIRSKSGGKDTLVTYIVSFIPLETRIVQDSICYGDTIDVNGERLWKSTVRRRTIPATTIGGCDILETFVLNVLPQPTKTIRDTIEEGQSIVFKHETLSQSAVRYDTLQSTEGKCDTILTYILTVLPPKKPPFRMFFFVQSTFGFEPGRSEINRDPWAAFHVGTSGNPDNKWYWKVGLGYYPSFNFRIPKELPVTTTPPEPGKAWNDCDCKDKKDQFSLHAGISYSISLTGFLGGQAGIRLSATADIALGEGPVKDLPSSQWNLPGAWSFQPAFFAQWSLPGGGTLMGELGPTLQAAPGSNRAGGQFRFRFVMPTNDKT